MDEQKRLLLALALMAAVVVVVTTLWPSSEQPPRQQQATSGQSKNVDEADDEEEVDDEQADGEEPAQSKTPAKRPTRELFPEKSLTLRTPQLVIDVNTHGGGISKAELLYEQYREGKGKSAKQIDLVSVNLDEHPELMPVAFNLVQRQLTVPASTQSAEGTGVIRLLNHGRMNAQALQAIAEIGSDIASKLIASRPYATIEDVESAIKGSESQKRRVMGKLLKSAWSEGLVRLDFEVITEEDDRVVLRGRTDGDISVVRAISITSDYEIRIEDKIKNLGRRSRHIRERLGTSGHEKNVSSGGWFQRPVGQLAGLCSTEPEMFRSNRSELAGESQGCMGISCGGTPGPVRSSGTIRFVAVDRHFFMSALSPSQSWGDSTCFLSASTSGEVRATVEPMMFTELQPGNETTYTSTLYLGPKKYNLLRELGPGRQLWNAIDYGWFAPLSRVLLRALQLFNGWFGNWGLSIIMLTVLIKLLLLPITHKSMKAMRKMQADMAPFKAQMDEIGEKYKNEPQKKQEKMMEFYNQQGINPLKSMAGGCLPMFLQMPIWIALYRMISESVELYRAPFFLWLTDLSAADPYYILPGLLGVAMFGQQMLTPMPVGQDQTQAKMMRWMMPIMFLFIMLNMPAGLVLYIFANTLLTIVQQQFINRMIPTTPAAVGKGSKDSKETKGSSRKGSDEPRKTDSGRASRKAKPKRRKRK